MYYNIMDNIHVIIFMKTAWTLSNCLTWLDENGFNYREHEDNDYFLCFYINRKLPDEEYCLKRLTKDVFLISKKV